MVLEGKSSQEYPVIAGVPQGSIPRLFLLYINDFPGNVICNIAIYDDDTTLYSKRDQASDLWQQFELTSELEPHLRDTVHWGKKWLADSNAGKTQLVSFDQSNNNWSIDPPCIHPCTEYCCHVWAGAPSCYLELLGKLQKRICRTGDPSLAASLEPLAHRQNVAELSLFYRYYFGRCS